MAEHSTLTDPYVHEPKGIVSAANGTVYVCNGSGSGAWSNIQANKREFVMYLPALGSANTWYLALPYNGTITAAYFASNLVPTTTADVLTLAIAGTPMTSGTITVPTSMTLGQVQSCTPTALNAVTAGASISVATNAASANNPSGYLTVILTLS